MSDLIDARVFCRNARCRTRLGGTAVGSFCCRGCFEQYHRHRCVVCDGEMRQPERGGFRVFCGRAECRRAYLEKPLYFNPFSRRKFVPGTTLRKRNKAIKETPAVVGSKGHSVDDRGSFDRLWGGDGVLSDWKPSPPATWGEMPDLPDFLRRV